MGIVVEYEEREDVERVPVCDDPYRPPSIEPGIPYRRDSLQSGKQDVY